MSAFRSGFDSIFSEDIPDRGVRYLMAQVGQGSLDAVIAPRGVFLGDAENELGHLVRNRRSARGTISTVAVVPFLGNQAAMPTENRVGSYNGGQLHHRSAAQSRALDRQYPALVIGQEDAFPSHLVQQDLDLGILKLDDLLLLAIDPAAQNQKEELPWA